ncbi:MAG: EAL domain-containing protein [Proteobacteria bacterium]|nr:EAL domain-containing protein [Pseudomonadota bacterium]
MNYLYRFVQHPRIYIAISTLLVLLLMFVVAWQANGYIDRNRDIPLVQSLAAYVSTLEGGTTNSQVMGAAILFGLENQGAKQLALGKLPPDAPIVLSVLDSLRAQFTADAIFILNKQGVIVAYSSKDNIHGRGRNLSSQSYVRLAMQGMPNVYPTVDSVSNHPDIYLAAPLRTAMDSTSETIGAIVIEVGYGKLDLLLKSWTDGIAILLSPQGVVFASSREDWLFRTTGKIAARQIADIRRTRQFGAVFDQMATLPFTLDRAETRIEGVRYAVRGLPLEWNDPAGDWQLVLLDRRAPWWTQWRVLSASALAGLFAAMILFWLFNLARNTFLLRKMNARLKRSDDILRESEQLLIETQNIAGLGTYLLDISTGLFEISSVTYQLLGIDDAYDHSMQGWKALIHPDDRAMMIKAAGQGRSFDKEYRIIRHNDQSERWMHGIGKLKFDAQGNPVQIVGTIQDITGRKQAEKEIQNLAFYDHLTGLPNRRLLLDRLRQTLAVCARGGLSGALLFIDLDNFKSLNDTLGHDIGDLLLQQVAFRLKSCVREDDSVARFGGDEFVVMLEDLRNDALEAALQAETVGEKILAALGHAYQLAAHEYHSTPSIGIALFNGHDKTMDELLKQADIAMYQAKKAGRNTLCFFDPEMQLAMMAHIKLESELRHAIDGQAQLLLYYQSQVDASGRLTGAEALVRWHHPERGMMSSDKFIPLAEESGLILPLGHWVLTTACRQLATWALQPATAHLTVSVNISARQFNLQTFAEMVLALMDQFGIGFGKLKLEITESLLLNNVADIIAKMKLLQDRGVNFSMDDFGTGYSSLQYLKQLPLDQIKIDQSFVCDLATNDSDKAIVRTIIAMAHSLNLNIIAEGVETEEQRQFLLSEGCTHYQGYLFGKPVPIDQFEAFFANEINW